MNNVIDQNGSSSPSNDEGKNVNLVESIIRFDCNGYNEDEDTDYKPDPDVEEEIIQEYQTEAEQLEADEVYHDFIETVNANISSNMDNLEDDSDGDDDDNYQDNDDKEQENKDNVEGAENFEDCDSTAYDSTCTETDLEEEEVRGQIDREELKLLTQEIPVKVPKSSLQINQKAYPPFWRVQQALQNVDSEADPGEENDPDYTPLSANSESNKTEDGQVSQYANIDPRNLQLRSRLVHAQGVVAGDFHDTSDDTSDEEEEDVDKEDCSEDDLENEVKELKEWQDLAQEVKGMVDMVEEMSFVDGEHDDNNDANFATNVLGNSNYFQHVKNVATHPSSIVDSIVKFDERTYQEDDDADYFPNENKENEICMQ